MVAVVIKLGFSVLGCPKPHSTHALCLPQILAFFSLFIVASLWARVIPIKAVCCALLRWKFWPVTFLFQDIWEIHVLTALITASLHLLPPPLFGYLDFLLLPALLFAIPSPWGVLSSCQIAGHLWDHLHFEGSLDFSPMKLLPSSCCSHWAKPARVLSPCFLKLVSCSQHSGIQSLGSSKSFS